jgi:hypothetical protein
VPKPQTAPASGLSPLPKSRYGERARSYETAPPTPPTSSLHNDSDRRSGFGKFVLASAQETDRTRPLSVTVSAIALDSINS